MSWLNLIAGFALVVSWSTALLVAGDLLIELRRLSALRRALRHSVSGVVTSDGELAIHEVDQRGRALDGTQARISFFDRHYSSELRSGRLRDHSGTEWMIDGGSGEVWPDDAQFSALAACPDAATFDAAFKAASGGQGFVRTLRTVLGHGAQVTVWGDVDRTARSVRPVGIAAGTPKLSGAGAAWAVIALNLIWCVAGTVLCFWPPAWGLVSKGGAVLLIGHFLGITPLAVAVRNAARSKAVAFRRGVWARP